MKESLLRYGIMIPCRNSYQQKKACQDMLIEDAKKYGFQYRLEEIKSRLFTLTNCIIGDLNSASTVYICAYDTPENHFFTSKNYYPLKAKKTKRSLTIETIAQILLAILSCVLTVYTIWNWRVLQMTTKVILAIICILLIICYLYCKFNKASIINMQRDSAAMALLHKLMSDKRKNEAFVFLDYACSSYIGIQEFLKNHSLSNEKVYYVDAIATGKIHAVHLDDTKIDENNNVVDMPLKNDDSLDCILKIIPNAILLVGGSETNDDILVTIKGKDQNVDIETLETCYKYIRKE